jgi:hypothetical protein
MAGTERRVYRSLIQVTIDGYDVPPYDIAGWLVAPGKKAKPLVRDSNLEVLTGRMPLHFPFGDHGRYVSTRTRRRHQLTLS